MLVEVGVAPLPSSFCNIGQILHHKLATQTKNSCPNYMFIVHGISYFKTFYLGGKQKLDKFMKNSCRRFGIRENMWWTRYRCDKYCWLCNTAMIMTSSIGTLSLIVPSYQGMYFVLGPKFLGYKRLDQKII